MRTLAMTMVLLILTSGCSMKCERAGIVGTYELTAAQNRYTLRLADDGSGYLSRNRKEIGPLRWEVEASTEQISLRSDREVLEVLRQLADSPPFPRDVAQWRSGYRGVTPKCGLTGVAKRLDLDVDGEKFFLRGSV